MFGMVLGPFITYASSHNLELEIKVILIFFVFKISKIMAGLKLYQMILRVGWSCEIKIASMILTFFTKLIIVIFAQKHQLPFFCVELEKNTIWYLDLEPMLIHMD